MKDPFIVHWMHGDKFTLPLLDELNKIFDKHQHHFFVLGQPKLAVLGESNITLLPSPFSKHGISNLVKVWRIMKRADLVIMHGIPGLNYLLLTPFVYHKLAWVIYGGTDLYLYPNDSLNVKNYWLNQIRKFMLKKVKIHLTHIEGDSVIANSTYHSNSSFFYHPVYLSNVINSADSNLDKRPIRKPQLKILVGHSTDPSNNHLEIFSWLESMEDILVFCPLSYGPYDDYKEEVKRVGFGLFGDRFIPIEKFMTMQEYKTFLNDMDIAVFNHKRQEAMGVTLMLLSLGKEVYVNSKTSSYHSLVNRGFILFDNQLLLKSSEDLGKRDVSQNLELLQNYYSYSTWLECWEKIYQIKELDQSA